MLSVIDTQSLLEQYIESDLLSYLQHQQNLFNQSRSALAQTHNRCFVWFEDGQVLDSDLDEGKLFERVTAPDPDRKIFIAQVLPIESQHKVRSAFLRL